MIESKKYTSYTQFGLYFIIVPVFNGGRVQAILIWRKWVNAVFYLYLQVTLGLVGSLGGNLLALIILGSRKKAVGGNKRLVNYAKLGLFIIWFLGNLF